VESRSTTTQPALDGQTREQIAQLTYAGEESTTALPVRDGVVVATVVL